MREEEVDPARGAQSQIDDIFFCDPGVHQLAAVGLCKIEEDLLRKFTVPGRSSGKEKERIAFVNLVRVLHLAKQFIRIFKL